MPKNRIESFSDGVIAILMTLQVFRLVAPVEPSFEALWDLRFRFLIYALVFCALAIYWVNHHHLFQMSKVIDRNTLWINILFLFFLSLFPFVSSWVDVNLGELVPEVAFGLVAMGANLSYALLKRQLIYVNGPDSKVGKAMIGFWKTKVTLILNVVGILVGFFFPPAVMISFALAMVLWMIPEKRIAKHLK